MNDRFEVIWAGQCNTGHYPFAHDIDNDGRDEIAIGYSMFDDGTKLWSLDATDDCRDEVVVWGPYELWVYTRGDSPRQGRLYKLRRNGLYNYSNYQATVSLPG